MTSYKLIYFNGRGRGEAIRFVFAQAGVQYEDKRVEYEEWPKLKPNTPFGQMPILEVDGKQVPGSRTICRLLAERFGLAGSNDLENAELDAISDFMDDFADQIKYKLSVEKDETRKAEIKKEIIEKQFPRYLGTLEKRIVSNNSPDGWIFGPKVTYIDFRLTMMIKMVQLLLGMDDILNDYPAIKKLIGAVNALPKIAEWISKRPKTQY